jgi:protein involved in polysaccharide export with SLBB domain
MTILFNGTSITPVSTAFQLSQQHTAYAVGLNPGDTITFEIVLTTPAAGYKQANPGCCTVGTDGPTIEIAGTQPLMCCTGTSVQLTSTNPVLVLDTPQGALLRAIYDGPNLGAFSLIVTPSNVTDVTDAMRGCCAAQPTGAAPHLVNGATAPLALGGGLTVTPAGEDNYVFTPLVTNTVVLTNCTGGVIHSFDTL